MDNMPDGGLQRHFSKTLTLMSLRSVSFWTSAAPRKGLAIAALMFSAAAVHAEETLQASCTNGDLVRRVVVVERSMSSGLSCEVVYWKDTEAPGKREVLWTAKQDAGYCYSKALAFASKLDSIGWSCALDN